MNSSARSAVLPVRLNWRSTESSAWRNSGRSMTPPKGPLRVGQHGFPHQGQTAAREWGGDRKPPSLCGVGRAAQAGMVLVVAAGELNVVQDDPVVRREDFGEGAQPGEEVGLVNGAQAARRGLVRRR